jgi:predicted metal-binding membrane protein
VVFIGGYLAAWLVYSIAAAAAQLAVSAQGWLDCAGALSPVLRAVVLIGAGLFQFAALKRACLTHCRNPLTYFLQKWRDGPANGFRIGFGHGIFCVACCWAMMATALAVGMMNLWWMIALTAVVFIEQVSARGEQFRTYFGIALVIGGAIQIPLL